MVGDVSATRTLNTKGSDLRGKRRRVCWIVGKGMRPSGESRSYIAATERLHRRRNRPLGLPSVLSGEGQCISYNKKDDTANTEGYEAHVLIVERRKSRDAGPAHNHR